VNDKLEMELRAERDWLLSLLKRFVQINRLHGYEFETNEPQLYNEMEAAASGRPIVSDQQTKSE
jgi:hypothetical protein